MSKSTIYKRGFTLFELLIAVAIVAILASISTPLMLDYMKKGRYSEIVQTADRYKASVAYCLEINPSDFSPCDGGAHGIPADITTGEGQVASATVVNGVITITPKATNGFASTDTYILTPTLESAVVTWVVSGGGCDSGFVTNCTGN